jgi:hypothetical protein
LYEKPVDRGFDAKNAAAGFWEQVGFHLAETTANRIVMGRMRQHPAKATVAREFAFAA